MGRVRSLARKTSSGVRGGKMLNPHRDGCGYPRVSLQRAPRKEWMSVHVIVLEAFTSPRPEGLVCRHLDGDPSNNNISNLVWGTANENMSDMIEHGRSARGERNANAKITALDVVEIRSDPRAPSVIAGEYGLAPCTVSHIKSRRIWKHIE